MVPNSHSHSTDKVNTSIGKEFQSGVTSLDSENLRELLDDFGAERILLLHGGRNDIVTVDVVGVFGVSACLENPGVIWMLVLHEFVDERHCRASANSLVRDSIKFSLASLVLYVH